MQRRFFFGYGSLVNRRTHDFTDAHPARLSGWRRVWRHTTRQARPFLTVEPHDGTVIDGLIAHVPNDDWHALDAREAGYDRVGVTHVVAHPAGDGLHIATYSVPEGKHSAPTEDLPIVLSYVDVVVQGYLGEFGTRGAERFFDTTAGWDAPLVNDRKAPHYSRAQRLSDGERDFVDACLRALGHAPD